MTHAGQTAARRSRWLGIVGHKTTTEPAADSAPGREWSAPMVRTLLDMASLPATVRPRVRRCAAPVVREWPLHDYGILMTADGVLHSLDPVAYRMWQLHHHHPMDRVVSMVVAEWDVEPERARAAAETVLDRLGAMIPAAGA